MQKWRVRSRASLLFDTSEEKTSEFLGRGLRDDGSPHPPLLSHFFFGQVSPPLVRRRKLACKRVGHCIVPVEQETMCMIDDFLGVLHGHIICK